MGAFASHDFYELAVEGGSSARNASGDMVPAQCVEIWEHIAYYLDVQSLCSLAQVNRFFSTIRWPFIDASHIRNKMNGVVLEQLLRRKPKVLCVPWASFADLPVHTALKEATPLQVLDISGSRLNSTALKQLRRLLGVSRCRLVTLRMRNCAMRDDSVPQLFALLKENRSIRHLNLEGNALQQLSPMHALLTAVPALLSLNISNNPLLPDAAESVGAYLAANPLLQTLNMECCRLDDVGVTAIGKALARNTHLLSLDLSENDFNDDGMRALCDMIKANKHLRHLRLSHNALSSSNMTLLGKALKANSSLAQLELQECQISNVAIQPLADVLACPTTGLRNLCLKFNCLGNVGARCLGTALRSNTTIQHLDLRFCDLSCQGTEAICDGLQGHPALQVLRLDNNRIGSDGMAALARLLKSSRSLSRLELAFNNVTDWDAGLLALALRQNPSIREISLEGSNGELTRVGVRALLEANSIHHSLKSLNVSRNKVTPDDIPAAAAHDVHCFHRKLTPIRIKRRWLFFRHPVVADGEVLFA